MTDKIQQARHMYMKGVKTQKEIAEAVGVNERTLYNWIKSFAWAKLKEASWAAPAVISGNLCSQLVEMQNAIAAREPGKRIPTLQEAEITRKIVTCIGNLKKYSSLPQQMQVIETFRNFIRPQNEPMAFSIGLYSELFLESEAKNGFVPYELEYGADRVAAVSPFYEEPQEFYQPQRAHNPQPQTSKIVGKNEDNTKPEIQQKNTTQYIDNKQTKPCITPFPVPEKTGNFPHTYPQNEIEELTKDLQGFGVLDNKGNVTRPTIRRQARNAPCACGSNKKYKHCHGKSG